MKFAHQIAFSLFTLAMVLGRTLRNLVLLPWITFRAFKLAFTPGFEPDIENLRAQLLVTFEPDHEVARRESRIERFVTLLESADYDTALAKLETWQTARRLSPGRSSLVFEALSAVDGFIVPQANDTAGPSDERLAALEGAYAERPDSPLMAAILAKAHVAAGWFWRGEGYANEISPADDEKFTHHFARAAEVLHPFEGIAARTPAIAIARHALFACHPDADTRIHDWFADWSKAEPEAINPYLVQGFLLLPRWFGAQDGLFEREALKAVARSEAHLGTGAYALLYLGTDGEAGCDPEVFQSCDTELFLHSLESLFARTQSDHLVNSFARRVYGPRAQAPARCPPRGLGRRRRSALVSCPRLSRRNHWRRDDPHHAEGRRDNASRRAV